MKYVDTNIFIRALIADDPEKSRACSRLLHRVDRGQEDITTCESIVSEVAFVLSSPANYRLAHEEVRARFAPYLRMRGLRLPGRSTYLEALDLFAQYPHLDFEDALCVAHMRQAGITEILSYDRDFDRIEGVTRIEP